jgi:hypothetical protein
MPSPLAIFGYVVLAIVSVLAVAILSRYLGLFKKKPRPSGAIKLKRNHTTQKKIDGSGSPWFANTVLDDRLTREQHEQVRAQHALTGGDIEGIYARMRARVATERAGAGDHPITPSGRIVEGDIRGY